MAEYRRTFIKIGQDLAIDFANTIGPAANPSGGLGSWRDLVDFLELRAAVTRSESAALRKMGERDARACAAALEQALALRESVRALLGAMADRRALKAEWIAAINQAAEDPEIRKAIRKNLREVHGFFEEVIREAQARGGVPADRDPNAEAWISLGVGLLRSISSRVGGLLTPDDFAAIGGARSAWLSEKQP